MEAVRIVQTVPSEVYEQRWIIESDLGWVGGPVLSFDSADDARQWLRGYPNLVEDAAAMLEP